MELPIPTSLLEQSLLTRFQMETKGCSTIEQLYQWRFRSAEYDQHFPPDRLKSTEAIRLTAGDGGPSRPTGFQKHSKA